MLQNINAEIYEQSLLCLPSHNKIEKNYIDKILENSRFLLKNEHNKKIETADKKLSKSQSIYLMAKFKIQYFLTLVKD